MTDLGDSEAALVAAHRAVSDRDRLRGQIQAAGSQAQAAEEELRERVQSAELEADDVRKLESFSGARIWAMLKGSRDIDLARERVEAEAAQGKAAEAKRRYDSAQAVLADLRRRMDAIGDVDAMLAEALHAKENFLVSSRSPQAERLTALAAERGALESMVTELVEAIDAGQRAQSELDALSHELSTASGWSTYDTFFGGGLISSAIKHDHMDTAAAMSRTADLALTAYRRELGDVDMSGVQGSLAMTDGTRFLDMWFDNIFTDLHVRSMINEARQRAATVRGQVAASLDLCRRRLDDAHARLRDIEQQRQAILDEGAT